MRSSEILRSSFAHLAILWAAALLVPRRDKGKAAGRMEIGALVRRQKI